MGRPERPLDPTAGPVPRLAHELRERRGSPPHPHIAVRDSKNPEVGTLTLSPEAYVAFVGHVGR